MYVIVGKNRFVWTSTLAESPERAWGKIALQLHTSPDDLVDAGFTCAIYRYVAR